MNAGSRLKIIRQNLNMTQKEFAEKLGFKWYKIKDMESNKQKTTYEIAKSIEKKFSINPDWLLTGEGEMYKKESAKNTNQEFTKIENNNINDSIKNLPTDIQLILEELLQMDKAKRKKILKTILSMEE
jgi:transcriptional regulator with XRE-family HTH domain